MIIRKAWLSPKDFAKDVILFMEVVDCGSCFQMIQLAIATITLCPGFMLEIIVQLSQHDFVEIRLLTVDNRGRPKDDTLRDVWRQGLTDGRIP